MQKIRIASIALAAFFAAAAPAVADLSFPADASVQSMPGAMRVAFHDGSTYSQTPAAFSADGPEAVRWFLKNTEDKFYGIFAASDLVSFQAMPAAGAYTFKFADQSQLQIAPAAIKVDKGLAQTYMAKIKEYEKTAPLNWRGAAAPQ